MLGLLLSATAPAQEVTVKRANYYATLQEASAGLKLTTYKTTVSKKSYPIYSNNAGTVYYILRQRKDDKSYYKQKVEFTK